jgi:hypothetical protein
MSERGGTAWPGAGEVAGRGRSQSRERSGGAQGRAGSARARRLPLPRGSAGLARGSVRAGRLGGWAVGRALGAGRGSSPSRPAHLPQRGQRARVRPQRGAVLAQPAQRLRQRLRVAVEPRQRHEHVPLLPRLEHLRTKQRTAARSGNQASRLGAKRRCGAVRASAGAGSLAAFVSSWAAGRPQGAWRAPWSPHRRQVGRLPQQLLCGRRLRLGQQQVQHLRAPAAAGANTASQAPNRPHTRPAQKASRPPPRPSPPRPAASGPLRSAAAPRASVRTPRPAARPAARRRACGRAARSGGPAARGRPAGRPRSRRRRPW